MADAWRYNYTDFGEGHGRSPQPVLRAVVGVATPGAPSRFAAIIDTGGPITVVASEVLRSGGDPVERNESMMLRLGGSTNEVALYDLSLEVRPPASAPDASPITWRSIVAVLDPWPHHGTAVILGQTGFLDTFTVTFGPDGFVAVCSRSSPSDISAGPESRTNSRSEQSIALAGKADQRPPKGPLTWTCF